jgi:hypothetical protein
VTQTAAYSSLRWAAIGRLRAEEILAAQRQALAMAAMPGRAGPLLLIAEAAEPAFLFGRFRRIPAPFLEVESTRGWATRRRMTGGRPVACAAGDLHLSLILDSSRELVEGAPVPLPPAKILNRYVRGVLGALQALGMRAFYPGRDFITVGKRRIGHLSFDVPGPVGAVLFEAILSREEPFDGGERILSGLGVALSDGPGCPAESTSVAAGVGRSVSAEELTRSIVRGYEKATRLATEEVVLAGFQTRPEGVDGAGTGREPAPGSGPGARVDPRLDPVPDLSESKRDPDPKPQPESELELERDHDRQRESEPEHGPGPELSRRGAPPADEIPAARWLGDRSPDPGLTASAAAAIPLGIFEVFVAIDAAGRIATVKLTGDFVADSPSLMALEDRLHGVAATWQAVGKATDSVFTRPPAVILGLGPLRTIPDTILSAMGGEPGPPDAT